MNNINSEIDDLKIVGLITRAKHGDQESMSQLAQVIEGRLFAYIYRLTLNCDLTKDLLQETLLAMIESLPELRRADRFWPWLFRTASGKVQHYFRDKRHRHMAQITTFDKESLAKYVSEDGDDGLNKLIRAELSDAIFKAMAKLKLSYRNVLVLRCYEQMSFAEIAEFMDCKELHARVLFFRAKHSLKRQLSRYGFGEGIFLTALMVFELLTTPAKTTSATAVTAASLEVGFAAAFVGTLCTKLGILTAAALAAITVTFIIKAFFWFIVLIFAALLIVCVDICTR